MDSFFILFFSDVEVRFTDMVEAEQVAEWAGMVLQKRLTWC